VNKHHRKPREERTAAGQRCPHEVLEKDAIYCLGFTCKQNLNSSDRDVVQDAAAGPEEVAITVGGDLGKHTRE
jgi:hypothetical protein